jgi:hypothetical protein
MGHSQNYEGTSKKWQNGRQDSAPTGVAKNFGKTKPVSLQTYLTQIDELF